METLCIGVGPRLRSASQLAKIARKGGVPSPRLFTTVTLNASRARRWLSDDFGSVPLVGVRLGGASECPFEHDLDELGPRPL